MGERIDAEHQLCIVHTSRTTYWNLTLALRAPKVRGVVKLFRFTDQQKQKQRNSLKVCLIEVRRSARVDNMIFSIKNMFLPVKLKMKAL